MSEPDKKQASGLYAFTIDRPIATTMVVLAVCVFGTLSYGRLRVDLMPEMNYPTLTVRTEYPGAAPEEVERELAKPIEDALRTVEDLSSISSVSRAGTCDVIMEFNWGAGMDFASQKVRERLDLITLPDEAGRPLLLRYDPTLDPIMRLGVYSSGEGEEDLEVLRRYAEDEVERAIEKLPGIAMVRVSGGEETLIRIELKQSLMAFYGLSSAQVIDRLRQENINLAGGQLDDGSLEYLVRTMSEFGTLDELRELIVARAGSTVVRLSDVADVRRDVADREVITRIGEAESVEIEIFKEADANIVEVAERVRNRVYGDPNEAKAKEEAGKGDARPRDKGKGGPPGKKRVPTLVETAPKGISIKLLTDRSVFIRAAIDEVVDTAFIGGVLAVIILFLFLRSFFSTTIIALSIPLSIVVTFGGLYLGDVSLNIMSLGGLALGIGMLVDNAVVVLESIHRCREEGDEVRAASLRGVREVGGAVIASTLTTVAVFLPIVFVEGVAGQIFTDLALSVVFSLSASLLVAVFFIPVMAARSPELLMGQMQAAAAKEAEERGADAESAVVNEPTVPSRARSSNAGTFRAIFEPWRRLARRWRESSWVRRLLSLPFQLLLLPYWVVRTLVHLLLWFVLLVLKVVLGGLLMVGRLLGRALSRVIGLVLSPVFWAFELGFGGVRKGYELALAAALRNRALVLIIAGLLLFGSYKFLGRIGTELIPEVHQGELIVDLTFPVETTLSETAKRVREIERETHAIADVQETSSLMGVRDAVSEGSGKGANTGEMTLILAPNSDVVQQEAVVIDALREVLNRQPGLAYEIRRPTLFSLRVPVEVELKGDILDDLKRVSREVEQALLSVTELTDVSTSLRRGYPEILVQLDRDALAARGLNARQVSDAVRQGILGEDATAFRSLERRIDIAVRLDRADITNREGLESLVVKGRKGDEPAVMLASVATISPPTEGPSEIRHIEGTRVVLVEATPNGVNLEDAVASVYRATQSIRLPPGVTMQVTGQSIEMETAQRSLFWALLLAVFLVYIVMATRFESVTSPLVILLTIPLAGVGVIGALVLTNIALSVVVFIGIIMLAGIVVNNAIVLVDYIIQLQQRGMTRRGAILDACSVRLRPVLITTLTTIFGLLPLALGLGAGAEIRAPMAIAVMAGLASSTLLTLIVVPVVYDLMGAVGGEATSD